MSNGCASCASDANDAGSQGNTSSASDASVASKATLANPKTKLISYEYDGDRLLSYNGERCEYDKLGNPTTYRGNKATWSHLRNLASYKGVDYNYNASGLRLSKKFGGRETKYCWYNGNLLRETRANSTTNSANNTATNTTIDYIYGADGIVGLILKQDNLQVRPQANSQTNEKTYYYIKNLQGDVTHIVDESGNIQARYQYDAWGNHTCVSPDGTKIYNNQTGTTPGYDDHIGNLNPIRYRGYYWDCETSLYYLQSRYYDPQVGRFLNADSIDICVNTQSDRINGLNLYAYCMNNPVMLVDSTGQFAISIFLAFLIVGAVTGGVMGGVNAYNNGARGWDLVGGIALGTLTGAALGAGVGLVAGLGGAFLTAGLVSIGNKFTTDLVALSMFGMPIGTWEDYAIAFIAGGLTKRITKDISWLKTGIDIVGRPLVTQLAKVGTCRQSEFNKQKFGYDIATRVLTFGIPAPWKSFARGITRGYWDIWRNGGSAEQYYMV